LDSPRPPVPRPRAAPPSFEVVADLLSVGSIDGERVLRLHLEQLLQAHEGVDVTVHWSGVAPAPDGPARFRSAVALASQYRRPGVLVRHVVRTTPMPLSEEWAECLAAARAVVELELGCSEALRGDAVVEVVDLLEHHDIDVNVACSVHAGNVGNALQLYRFLRDDCHLECIEWVPHVERIGDEVTVESVDPADWGRFLIAVFDEWVRHDVGEVIVVNFEAALGKWLGRHDGPCIFEERCGCSLALTSDGTLFSCERFQDDGRRLGNIGETHLLQLIAKPEQVRFGLSKQTSLPGYCMRCPVRFACNGECPKHRFDRTPDGEEGLNHLCAGYRAFFMHIDRPMRRLVELVVAGRFIEDVMTEEVPTGEGAASSRTASGPMP
jgi:uncharacterized protein